MQKTPPQNQKQNNTPPPLGAQGARALRLRCIWCPEPANGGAAAAGGVGEVRVHSWGQCTAARRLAPRARPAQGQLLCAGLGGAVGPSADADEASQVHLPRAEHRQGRLRGALAEAEVPWGMWARPSAPARRLTSQPTSSRPYHPYPSQGPALAFPVSLIKLAPGPGAKDARGPPPPSAARALETLKPSRAPPPSPCGG